MSKKSTEPALPPVAVPPGTREQAEASLFQALQKLGLHVNGANSIAVALSDAFNQVQERYNSYQNAVAAMANENRALHETVTELKNRLARAEREKRPDPAKGQDPRPLVS